MGNDFPGDSQDARTVGIFAIAYEDYIYGTENGDS